MRPITFEENADAVAAELNSRLGQFNDQRAGPRNVLKFVLALRDDNGELVGGLVGRDTLEYPLHWRALGARAGAREWLRHGFDGAG